jgi:hypothetical protein
MRKIKVVMMKNIIMIKKERKPHQNGKLKRRKTYISKIKFFTPKRKVGHLKRAMKVSLIVKEKKLISWP